MHGHDNMTFQIVYRNDSIIKEHTYAGKLYALIIYESNILFSIAYSSYQYLH